MWPGRRWRHQAPLALQLHLKRALAFEACDIGLKFAFFVEQPLFEAFDIHGYLSIRLYLAVISAGRT